MAKYEPLHKTREFGTWFPENPQSKYNPAEFFNRKKRTNADRIRGMSDRELAEYLSKVQGDIFRGEMRLTHQWLDWLQQEVNTNDN